MWKLKQNIQTKPRMLVTRGWDGYGQNAESLNNRCQIKGVDSWCCVTLQFPKSLVDTVETEKKKIFTLPIITHVKAGDILSTLFESVHIVFISRNIALQPVHIYTYFQSSFFFLNQALLKYFPTPSPLLQLLAEPHKVSLTRSTQLLEMCVLAWDPSSSWTVSNILISSLRPQPKLHSAVPCTITHVCGKELSWHILHLFINKEKCIGFKAGWQKEVVESGGSEESSSFPFSWENKECLSIQSLANLLLSTQ